MCRLAGYVGPEIPLSGLLFDPAHSLQHQAYAPRELLYGHVNVDGTGVAWWDSDEDEPLRYITDRSPWADLNLRPLARRITSGFQLAAVRAATPSIGYGPSFVSPFIHGSLAGMHNGFLAGFHGAVGRHLIGALPDEQFAELHSMSDSLALFLTIGGYFSDKPDLAYSVRATITDVTRLIDGFGTKATLNLVVGDGKQVVATRHSVADEQNSLYALEDGAGRWLASEPLDDRAWEPVPKSSLVTLSEDGVRIESLG